jgi:hypothetical protein
MSSAGLRVVGAGVVDFHPEDTEFAVSAASNRPDHFVVGFGERPHLVRSKAEFAERRMERSAAVTRHRPANQRTNPQAQPRLPTPRAPPGPPKKKT